MKHQRTIDHDVKVEGRGLFTGESVVLRVRPAKPHTGIWFVRTDQSPPIRIAAHVDNVSKRARRTSLRNGSVAIETVEHCLSACAGLGLDNLEIDLDGDELPSGDGSSMPFVEALQKAGVTEQDAMREPYVVSEMIRVVDGDSELIALPPIEPEGDLLRISYELDYGPDNPIGRQQYDVVVTPENFIKYIAPARTFVTEMEAEQLRTIGMGTHLNYEDVLVFGKDGPIDNPLRFENECVRHKILDLIGDLTLFGQPLAGRVFARKSGHALNHSLVRALHEKKRKQESDAWLRKKPAIATQRIHRILPHRYPFLMVDRIIEIEGSTRVVGVKNVTINEAFFQGHYPGDPIMPGVLIIEALAQVGGVLLSQELEHKGKIAVLLGLDKVKFRRPVRPGDQLILEAEAVRVRSTTGHIRGRATVDGECAAEAEIKFMLTDVDHG